MNRPGFSPMQNFSAELIERVGCISVWQMYTILYKLCQAKPSVVKYMLHDFTAKGICHFDSKQQYIVAGKSAYNQLQKFDKNTIYGIAVALAVIEDPSDYKTIYKPFYGEDLRFMSGDKAYAVLVNKEDNISKLMFYQKQYDDYIKEAAKRYIKEEKVAEAYSKLIITYPIKADMKTAFKNVDSLELTMPHALCFTEGNGIFEEIKIRMVEA